MEIGFPFLDSLFNILVVLAVIPALWVAGRIVVRDSAINQISVRLFVWLVLGGFFLRPLVGLVSLVRNILSVALSEHMASSMPAVEFAFLGLTPQALYAAMDAVVWLVGYGIALVYGPRLMQQYGRRIVQVLGLTPLEQAFAVLGLAGLLITMLNGFTSYAWPVFGGQMEGNSLSGLFIWAVGFLLLITIAIAMRARLARV